MDAAQQAEARRRSRSWTLSVAGLAAAILLVAVTIALVVPPRHGHHRDVVGAVIAISVLVVALALSLWFTAWMYRRRSFQQLFQFRNRDRRRVARRLRKGQPIDDADLRIAAATANVGQQTKWTYWLAPVLSVHFALQTFRRSGGSRWIELSFLLVYVGALLLSLWQRRRLLRNWAKLAPRYRELHRDVMP